MYISPSRKLTVAYSEEKVHWSFSVLYNILKQAMKSCDALLGGENFHLDYQLFVFSLVGNYMMNVKQARISYSCL